MKHTQDPGQGLYARRMVTKPVLTLITPSGQFYATQTTRTLDIFIIMPWPLQTFRMTGTHMYVRVCMYHDLPIL